MDGWPDMQAMTPPRLSTLPSPSFAPPRYPQAALDEHTVVDARGVRRPLDRALAFFPLGSQPPSSAFSSSSSSSLSSSTAANDETKPPASPSGGEEHMDHALLRRAVAARRAQVTRLTEFRSRRTREIEARRHKTKVRARVRA